NTDSTIWTQISNKESFLVASQQDGWVEVEIDDTNAFISSDYVDVQYGLNEAIPYTPVVAGSGSKGGSGGSSSGGSSSGSSAGSSAGSVSSRRAEIANYAVQFVGNPYVYGGTRLTKRADCSGFSMSGRGHLGGSPPPPSSSQGNWGRAHPLRG